MDRNAKASSLAIRSCVALRKESVDRNFDTLELEVLYAESLSARRAWIEITSQVPTWFGIPVALRKESVDRNKSPVPLDPVDIRRSPQGERG